VNHNPIFKFRSSIPDLPLWMTWLNRLAYASNSGVDCAIQIH